MNNKVQHSDIISNNLPLWITEHLRKNSVWLTLKRSGVDIAFEIFKVPSLPSITSNLLKHTTNICGDLTISLSSSHIWESHVLEEHLLSCWIVLKCILKFSTNVVVFTGILWEYTLMYFVSFFPHSIQVLFFSIKLRTITSKTSWSSFFISSLNVSIRAS